MIVGSTVMLQIVILSSSPSESLEAGDVEQYPWLIVFQKAKGVAFVNVGAQLSKI